MVDPSQMGGGPGAGPGMPPMPGGVPPGAGGPSGAPALDLLQALKGRRKNTHKRRIGARAKGGRKRK